MRFDLPSTLSRRSTTVLITRRQKEGKKFKRTGKALIAYASDLRNSQGEREKAIEGMSYRKI